MNMEGKLMYLIKTMNFMFYIYIRAFLYFQNYNVAWTFDGSKCGVYYTFNLLLLAKYIPNALYKNVKRSSYA